MLGVYFSTTMSLIDPTGCLGRINYGEVLKSADKSETFSFIKIIRESKRITLVGPVIYECTLTNNIYITISIQIFLYRLFGRHLRAISHLSTEDHMSFCDIFGFYVTRVKIWGILFL